MRRAGGAPARDFGMKSVPADAIDLFPPIEPYQTGQLGVGGPHVIYWEVSGNPDGIPVVFLHGGPGAGASPAHRRFFDPSAYRVVIFDQRGAGRSSPLGELTDNTTGQLIEDMERLRCHLDIDRWVLFGGSWGSTLALAYAQQHPKTCLAMVLRGIFLCQQAEIDWFLYGMGRFFPEAARAFREFLPNDEQSDLLDGYYRRLIDQDPKVHGPAARAWSLYEGSCSTLLPNPEMVRTFAEDRAALGLARIEAHYFRHRAFLDEGQLLRGLDAIAEVPATIVQGRYDVICPPHTAEQLATAWPQADLIMVPDAGHSAMEPNLRAALLAATERLKAQIHAA